MSRWREQFENHQIHKSLEQIREAISGEPKGEDDDELMERRRLEKIVSAYEDALSKVDPEVLPFQLLDNITNTFNQKVLPPIQQYQSDGSVGDLKNANDQITAQLNVLAIVRVAAGEIDIVQPPAELEKQIDEFAAAVAKKRQDAEGKISELTSEVGSIRQKLEELVAQIEARRQEVDNQISEWQGQFSQAQEARNKEFSDWKSAIDSDARQQIKNVVEPAEKQLKQRQEKFEADIESYITQAEEKHQAIRDLHQLAAEDSVAGGYVSNAKREDEKASRWRVASILFIVTAAAWLLFSFLSGEGASNWQATLMSFSLTGVLLFGAAYSAQQSTRHRNVEVHNRRFALEMTAIDPYLQSLSDEDQRELKKELTRRFFGHEHQVNGSSVFDEHASMRTLQAVDKHVLRPLADLAKNVKQ
jgi:hypothetical protein